jgi:hypothetical protein
MVSMGDNKKLNQLSVAKQQAGTGANDDAASSILNMPIARTRVNNRNHTMLRKAKMAPKRLYVSFLLYYI